MAHPTTTRVLTAAILGSGAVFVEGTVVNVALPAIGRDLGLGLDGLQWVVDAYLLTMGSLILLGGALGDRYGRSRVFRAGAAAFAVTSTWCAFAPGSAILIVVRLCQGLAGAMLVPNSLALLEETFSGEAYGTAVGRWSAGSAASTAIGPLAGGLILGAVSWRWIFALVAPFALAAALVLPRSTSDASSRSTTPIDYAGAVLVTLGLGALMAGLIEWPRLGSGNALVRIALIGSAVLLAAFVQRERRARHPLLDLAAFRSARFSGANLATLLIYGALNVLLFLLILVLQNAMGYSALTAGATLLPVNVLLFVLSPAAGRLAGRLGPRLPMTVGALLAGAGMLLLSRVQPDSAYTTGVLPAVLVFGAGLALLVAPLTAAALAALGPTRAGLASGVNNAVARVAGLVAVAAVPLAAGMGALDRLEGRALMAGFHRAMWIGAGLSAAAAAVSWMTMAAARRRVT